MPEKTYKGDLSSEGATRGDYAAYAESMEPEQSAPEDDYEPDAQELNNARIDQITKATEQLLSAITMARAEHDLATVTYTKADRKYAKSIAVRCLSYCDASYIEYLYKLLLENHYDHKINRAHGRGLTYAPKDIWRTIAAGDADVAKILEDANVQAKKFMTEQKWQYAEQHPLKPVRGEQWACAKEPDEPECNNYQWHCPKCGKMIKHVYAPDCYTDDACEEDGCYTWFDWSDLDSEWSNFQNNRLTQTA